MESDLIVLHRHQRLCVNRFKDWVHNVERQKERDANQDLIGWRLGGTHGLPQQREHDDDSREGGHENQDRRQQAEHGHHDDQLERKAVLGSPVITFKDFQGGNALCGHGL